MVFNNCNFIMIDLLMVFRLSDEESEDETDVPAVSMTEHMSPGHAHRLATCPTLL